MQTGAEGTSRAEQSLQCGAALGTAAVPLRARMGVHGEVCKRWVHGEVCTEGHAVGGVHGEVCSWRCARGCEQGAAYKEMCATGGVQGEVCARGGA